MKLLIKVLEHEFIDTVLTTEIIDSEVVIDEDIGTFAVARFSMPLIDIEEYNIVEIYEVENTDTRIFRGYVYKIEPVRNQFWIVNIECRSEKAIMNDRKVLLDKDYIDKDIWFILNDLISDYSIYETWTYEVDFTKTINLKLNEWDDYFWILDELAEQCEAQRDIVDKKILFKRNFWTDRTSWINYQEINYNWLFPNNANISNIRVIGTATRNNIVIGKWQEDTKHTSNDYVDRLYWVAFERFREWDIIEKTDKELEKQNKNQRIYEITVEQNSIIANIYDKMKLVVENTNSFFDIDSDVYVIGKTINYTNWSKITSYKVGELDLDVINIENWLYGIQKSVKLLKSK